MKKVFSLFFIFFLTTSLHSFNIVDRLASPFAYDDNSSYSPGNYGDYSQSKKETSSSEIFFLIVIIIIALFLPSGRRYYGYTYTYDYSDDDLNYHRRPYSSIAAELGSAIMLLLTKKAEKKYKTLSEEEIIKKEEEAIATLKNLNLNPEEFKNLAKYALEQYILMLSGKKNDIPEISTDYLYQKCLKEIASLHENELRTEIENFSIDEVRILNIRYTNIEKAISFAIKYTSRQYLVDEVNKNFVSGERFPGKKILFFTFIQDGKWKLSLIEQKGESYVGKLENVVGANNSIKAEASPINSPVLDIPKPKLQLMIAELFFSIYSWWQNPADGIKTNIDDNLLNKIKTERMNLKENKNIIFNINKFQIIKLDFLSFEGNPAIIKRFIVRITFLIKGRFIKNSFALIDEKEQQVDEIWEFEIDKGKIILKDIVKKFISSSKDIEPNPLQMEWYI